MSSELEKQEQFEMNELFIGALISYRVRMKKSIEAILICCMVGFIYFYFFLYIVVLR